ncbi:fra a 1-associated protein [Ricinus communis]|uniref:fra a 1-associated protein n=1 Tax=Ricinus communis TaxID=3988 RepID=UPI00201AFBBA|nr:fra a 1-associated protein [Ricinus communis]
MGWVWRDDDEKEEFSSSSIGGDISEYKNKNNNPNYSSPSDKVCSTRKVVKSQCKTEEVEPGKFVRKCEKSEEILRECLGEPVEVLKSNKEYTEDDVTDLVAKGSSTLGKFDNSPFDFPGLRSDIEGLERHFLGGIGRLFEAAEQMRSSIFYTFGELYKENSSPSPSRGIPIEDYSRREASPKARETESGNVDLSGLAKDV